MTGSLNWTCDNGTLSLIGELDGDTVFPLWQARTQVLAHLKEIDLRALTRIDTAGIALLIHLVAAAQQQNTQLQWRGMSDKLITLLQLYNLPEAWFPRTSS